MAGSNPPSLAPEASRQDSYSPCRPKARSKRQASSKEIKYPAWSRKKYILKAGSSRTPQQY